MFLSGIILADKVLGAKGIAHLASVACRDEKEIEDELEALDSVCTNTGGV